jgi:hypothetical protein
MQEVDVLQNLLVRGIAPDMDPAKRIRWRPRAGFGDASRGKDGRTIGPAEALALNHLGQVQEIPPCDGFRHGAVQLLTANSLPFTSRITRIEILDRTTAW